MGLLGFDRNREYWAGTVVKLLLVGRNAPLQAPCGHMGEAHLHLHSRGGEGGGVFVFGRQLGRLRPRLVYGFPSLENNGSPL